jgi:hypothetical protein
MLAAGSAGWSGCAQLDSALNFASLETRPVRNAATPAAPTTMAAAAPSSTPLIASAAAGAVEPVGPQLLPPVNSTAHEAAKPPSWSIFNILTPSRPIDEPHEAPASEFTKVADIQLSPAAVPTKEELLAKLRSRPDVDSAEYDRWEKIVVGTPENDWPLVAIQLQAVLNYKSFQGMQGQASQPSTTPPAPAPESTAMPASAAASTETAAAATPAPETSSLAEGGPDETAKSEAQPAAVPEATAASVAATPAESKPEVLPTGSEEKPPQPIASAQSAAPAANAAGSWREHLERAIEALEADLNATPDAPAQVVANASPPSEEEYRTQAERRRQRARQEAYLRLLYIASRRQADAARGVDEFSPAEKEFWKHQLYGLAVFLDDEGAPIADRRARLALRELQQGMHHLAAASGLDVRNLAFCPQVFSFGNYVEFTPAEFRPGQEVLLYAEIDHFAVEPKPHGFETELQGSYQIFDAAGRRVAEHTFPPEKELCRNRRRDYFIPFRMYLPKRMDPGPYTLQLTIEDLKGRKFGQSSIRFGVVN